LKNLAQKPYPEFTLKYDPDLLPAADAEKMAQSRLAGLGNSAKGMTIENPEISHIGHLYCPGPAVAPCWLNSL
jgi:hypothetical protein